MLWYMRYMICMIDYRWDIWHKWYLHVKFLYHCLTKCTSQSHVCHNNRIQIFFFQLPALSVFLRPISHGNPGTYAGWLFFGFFFNLYIFVPRHSSNPLTHSLCLFRVLGLVYNYSHFLNHVSQACAFFRKTPNQLEQLSAPHFGDFQFWNTPESYRENCAKVCCRSGARQGCAKRWLRLYQALALYVAR